MNAYSHITPEMIQEDLRYLQLLSRSFPTIAAASTEIINLEAIINLPKGTEHFLADLHGEYEAFQHVLRNASGAIKRKVNEIFGTTLRESEKKELCTLIYYPEQKLNRIKSVEKELDDWYQITLYQLVAVCQNVSSKYTRSKVRKSLPKEFAYIIEELLHDNSMSPNKQAYIEVIISSIISTRRADDFIIALCNLIQRLTIDTLHILGDIFDRGPGPHHIMDILCNYHNWDIQWGNHDILWMGAAAGNDICMANVVRFVTRFGNVNVLEDGYGISLLPLATFAMETYADDLCSLFGLRPVPGETIDNPKTLRLLAQMHKAISIIQFKLEAETIRRRPEFDMDDCLRANKSLSAWGVEGRVPFLDKEFLDVAMSLDPAVKMCPGQVIEKKIVREAFADMLPESVAWRQKEQFSDGVGYSWIDTLKAITSEAVSDEQMAHAAERFPINTPMNKEEYYYRTIFEEHFPSESAALSVPHEASIACSTAIALEWDKAWKGQNEPSGRAVKGVHEEAY